MSTASFDVAIVGMGIVGLAHAYWAARAGKRVVVIDRDAQANDASIRNFGFITVTGQSAGDMWTHAKRSRDVWASIAPALSTPIQHYGLCVTAQRTEAETVLLAFRDSTMGQHCDLVDASTVHQRYAGLPLAVSHKSLLSPYELRFEAPEVLPALTTYLKKEWDVTFATGTSVYEVNGESLHTSGGDLTASHSIICPGADFSTLFAHRIAPRGLKKCKLQMMRVADPGYRLPFAVQSDLSLVRYEGYADLPEAAPLLTRIKAEQPDHLKHGIHLIVVQNADGSLVIGDSHHYADTPTPFYETAVERLIEQEFNRVFTKPMPPVLERWTGVYAYGKAPVFVDTPQPNSRLVIVTCGAGMSTAFGIAEKTVHDLLGAPT